MKLTHAKKIILVLLIAVLLVTFIATAYLYISNSCTVGGDFLASANSNTTTANGAHSSGEKLVHRASDSDTTDTIDDLLFSGILNNIWFWAILLIVVIVLAVVAIIIASARKK